MKTKILCSSLLLPLLFLMSCQGETDFVSREESYVNVDCLSQTVEQNIMARGEWWIDLNGSEWIHVTPERGTGDGIHYQMYSLSVDYNKGGSREGTIYICQGQARCPVTVHQGRCKFGFTGVSVTDSLYQFKESTSGINVKYEYAAGDESVSVSATLSGAASAGLSIAPTQSSDFSPGSGAIFVPISGTPTVKGDFEVKVTVDGLIVGTAKGSVAEYVAPVVVLDPSGLPAKWNFFAAGLTGTAPLETEQGRHWDVDDPDPHVQATGGNSEARLTAVIKNPGTVELNGKPQRYIFNPAIQALSMVEGDYWLATIPVMYFTEDTKISVEAAVSTASKGPGFYILEYSADQENWFEAPGATDFTKTETGETWKAHFWNNARSVVNAPTGTRKSFNPADPDETYHKYEFPLTGITIDDGNFYLRLRVLKYRYDMSTACTATWTDLKMLEVNFVEK